MKILRLTLKNLASLVDAELDYRAEPLASAGLMAITGPTGSGKSTILDAMCLALFGQVPRLRSASKGQDGRVPDGMDNESLTMHDPRTLLRRGATEGFAEVEFVGLDGRVYSANWQVRRARNKSTGNLLAATRVLKDLTSGQTLTNQVRECDAQISQLIGLNFEQFTRAVMLAQSEFGAFLKASDVERAQLLERLLETDIYRRLGEFAFEKRKKYQEAYQTIKSQIGDLIPLELDARVALETSISMLAKTRQNLESRKAYLLASQHWFQKQTQLYTQLNESQSVVQQSEVDWLSLAAQREKVQQLEQLSSIRPVIAQQQTLGQRIVQHQQELAEQKISLEEIKKQYAVHQAHNIEAGARRLAVQNLQIESRPKITSAQGLEQDVGRLSTENIRLLQQIDEQSKQCQTTQLELEQNQKQQVELSQHIQKIIAQLNQTDDLAALDEHWSVQLERMIEAEKISRELAQLTQDLPQLEHDASQKTLKFQQVNQLLEQHRQAFGAGAENNTQLLSLKQLHAQSRQADLDLRTLSQKYQNYVHVLNQIAELKKKSDSKNIRLKQLEQSRVEVQRDIQIVELELKTLLKLLEQQRLLRNKNVESLRSQLQDDQPCPVCGSQEHPFSVASHLLEALENEDEQQEKHAREKLTQVQKQQHAIETELKLLNKELGDLAAELDRFCTEEKSRKNELKQIPFAEELRAQATDVRSEWLAQKIIQTNQSERDLSEKITTLEKQLAAEVVLIQNVEQARFNHAESQQKVQVAQSHQAQLVERLARTEQYFLPILDERIQQNWRNDRHQTIADLQEQMTARSTYQTKHKNQQEQLIQYQNTHQLLQQKSAQEVAKHIELDRHQKEIAADLVAKQTQLTQILKDASESMGQLVQTVSEWQTQLEHRLIQAQNEESRASNQVHLLDKQIQKLMTTADHIGQQLVNDEKALILMTNQISDWHKLHPTLSSDEFSALLAVTLTEEQQLKQHIEQVRHRQIEAKARLTEHQRQLEQHQQGKPVSSNSHESEVHLSDTELASAIEDNIQQFELSQQEWMSLQFQLKQDDECKSKSTSLQLELQKAEAEYHRIDRMVSLIASKDGKVFQKIAQAYFLDRLLEDTNQQLSQLTQRYQLVRAADSLGLLVIDSDMGDERRSVHSLSGGESFLVSLALALGLASMASGRLRIESLFIDEGFGTLDPESLQVVMDALDRLQSQGRKVTVITHVQEMHERIPTQIQIKKIGNGQSRLMVV